jgi:hypothetical protein
VATFFVIRKQTGAISLLDWDAIVDSTSYLERAPERAGVNPFTKEPIFFWGRAHFLVHGKRVGNIVLDRGRLLATGVPRSKCAEIARRLGARVYDGDRS